MSSVYVDDIEMPPPGKLTFPSSNSVSVQPIPFSSNPNVFSTGVSDRRIQMEFKINGTDVYDRVEQLRGRIENQSYNIVKAFGLNLVGNNDTIYVSFDSFSPEYPPGVVNYAIISLEGSIIGFPNSHNLGYYFAWKQRANSDSTLGTQRRFIPRFGTFNHTETQNGDQFPDVSSFGGKQIAVSEYDLAKVQSDVTTYDAAGLSRQGLFFDAEPDYLHIPAWRVYDNDEKLITTTRVFNENKVYFSFGPSFQKNRVPNPTLTVESNSNLHGWNVSTDSTSNVVETEIISGLPRSDKSFNLDSGNMLIDIPIKESTEYTASVYVSGSTTLTVDEFDSSGTNVGTQNTSGSSGRLSLTFTTDSTAATIRLKLSGTDVNLYGCQLEQSSSVTDFEHIGWPFDYGYIFDLENDEVHLVMDKEDWATDETDYNGRNHWTFSIGTLAPLRVKVNNLDQLILETGAGVDIEINREPTAYFKLKDQVSQMEFSTPSDVVEDGTTTAPDHTLWLKDTSSTGTDNSLRAQSNYELAWDNTNDIISNNEGSKTDWYIALQAAGWSQSASIQWYGRPSFNTYREFV